MWSRFALVTPIHESVMHEFRQLFVSKLTPVTIIVYFTWGESPTFFYLSSQSFGKTLYSKSTHMKQRSFRYFELVTHGFSRIVEVGCCTDPRQQEPVSPVSLLGILNPYVELYPVCYLTSSHGQCCIQLLLSKSSVSQPIRFGPLVDRSFGDGESKLDPAFTSAGCFGSPRRWRKLSL